MSHGTSTPLPICLRLRSHRNSYLFALPASYVFESIFISQCFPEFASDLADLHHGRYRLRVRHL